MGICYVDGSPGRPYNIAILEEFSLRPGKVRIGMSSSTHVGFPTSGPCSLEPLQARPAPLPPDEDARLALLHSYCVLDTAPEPVFDELTALATGFFDAPIVLISLVDAHRQFFKSVVGLSITETSRNGSFCAYALLSDEPLIVPDAHEDQRFRGNPLVTGEPFIRFYAGAPLVAERGLKLGTFCVIDRKPRSDFGASHYKDLQRFAALASKLIQRKMVDPLTGIHNRTSLLQHLQWRIDQQSSSLNNYALLFLDLDSFKRINNSLGHLKGNALLIEVARRLEQTVRGAPGSLVARLGGDEFAVLAGDLESEEDALTYAASFKHLLESPVDCHGQRISITASIGVVFGHPGVYTESEQMLEDADVAMYRAKLNGKAQSTVFSQKMRAEAVLLLQCETDLRIALDEAQFELHYQPKIGLDTGQVTGFEALIRWRHPKRGLIPPASFIPVAEQTGLISEVGRWAASEAMQQLAQWRLEGAVDPDASIAVNVSTKQLNESDLLDWIAERLRTARLPSGSLTLEITESALIENSQTTADLLHSIAAAGIGLDLDDFGTGFSSLSYLHRFPFRSVKIDRSFVSRMSEDLKSANLVASILGLARSLKMSVIAEGVETEAQVKLLRDMGCAVAQGYLFSAPKPPRELGTFLKKSRRTLHLPQALNTVDLPMRDVRHLTHHPARRGVFHLPGQQ